MAEFKSKYEAKQCDERGYVNYTAAENEVWHDLFVRQKALLPNRACDAFIHGLQKLGLSGDHMPQLVALSTPLFRETGWKVAPVPALIPHQQFFELLASKHFPAATFIRTREDFDYITEPDMFHEAFGHCPMLTDQIFADFTEKFAKLVLAHDEEDWPLLQRFYWFTVEFGLIQEKKGLCAYGGGIISSPKELVYSVESDIAERRPFDVLNILRTPYRIDIPQPIYYVIEDYQQLYTCLSEDLDVLMEKARALGEFEPSFAVDDNPTIHINYC